MSELIIPAPVTSEETKPSELFEAGTLYAVINGILGLETARDRGMREQTQDIESWPASYHPMEEILE